LTLGVVSWIVDTGSRRDVHCKVFGWVDSSLKAKRLLANVAERWKVCCVQNTVDRVLELH
jgi:hypothetical protein